MMKISITLFTIVITFSAIIDRSYAGNEEYVTPHNEARAAVGVPPMTWDDGLAADIGNYITTSLKASCEMEHSQGEYGENLAWCSAAMTPDIAVKMWVDEGKTYNYDTNTCADGDVCGHYTQVVWKTSVKVGCASVTCDNGGTIIGCRYTGPGNVVGEKPW